MEMDGLGKEIALNSAKAMLLVVGIVLSTIVITVVWLALAGLPMHVHDYVTTGRFHLLSFGAEEIRERPDHVQIAMLVWLTTLLSVVLGGFWTVITKLPEGNDV